MHPRKFIRDSIGIAFSQYVVRMVLMARGLVAARLLGPHAFGAWNGLSLILDYGVLATFGTQQGLDQVVPGRIVAGDAEALRRVKRAGLFNILLLSSVFGLVVLGYFAASPGRLRDFWGLGGIATMLGCATVTCVSFYHLTLLRSHGDTSTLGRWNLIQGIAGAVIGLALLPMLGAWGLLIGWCIGAVAAAWHVRARAGATAPLAPSPSRDSLLLLSVGFPMFLFNGSNLMMRTFDRLVILRFLGTEPLGYYSLGVMALALMLYLPDSVSYVIYPQLQKRYHEAGDRPEVLHDPFERTMRTLALLVPIFCGMVYLAAEDVVAWVLPTYMNGLVPLKVLGFGAAGLALANLSSIALMTLGRRMVLIPAALFMVALGVTLDWLAVRQGLGIAGVAWATIIAYTLNGVVMLWLAGGALRIGYLRRFKQMATGFAPLLIGIGLALFLDQALPWPDAVAGKRAFLRLLFGLPLFVAIYGLMVYPLARGLGLRQLASEFHLPGASLLMRASERADAKSKRDGERH